MAGSGPPGRHRGRLARGLLALLGVSSWAALPGEAPAPRASAQPSACTATVFVHDGLVAVRGEPHSRVWVEHYRGSELLSSNGGFEPLGADGSEVFWLSSDTLPAEDTTLEAGDRVWITPWQGQPRPLDVPVLAAEADGDASRILGLAAPGALLELVLWRDDREILRRHILADASGSVLLDLAADLSLRPGDQGRLVQTNAEGDVFFVPLGVVGARIDLDKGAVDVEGPPRTRLFVTVSTSEGSVKRDVGIGLAPRVRGSNLADVVGTGAALIGEMEAGDVVTLSWLATTRLPPGGFEQTVPRLEVHLDMELRRIRVTGPPNSEMVMRLGGPEGQLETLTIRTDAAGTFAADLDHALDGWQADLAYDPGTGIRFHTSTAALTVDLVVHGNIVRGRAAPGATVRVVLRDAAGRERAADWGRADGSGEYCVGLGTWVSLAEDPAMARQEAVVIRPGDRVEVEASGQGDPLTLLVPVLTARTDGSNGTVTGTAPPGAAVEVTYDPPFVPGMDGRYAPAAIASTVSVADPEGIWRADVAALLDGLGLDADLAAAGGRVIVRQGGGVSHTSAWRWLQSSVSLGSPWLQATGAPGRAVDVSVVDPRGTVVASGHGTTSGLYVLGSTFTHRPVLPSTDRSPGEARVGLEDALGQAVAVVTGDRITVLVGDDRSEYVVPAIEGIIDVEEGAIRGRTVPEAELAVDVRVEEDDSAGRQSYPLRTDESGAFRIAAPGGRPLGWTADVRLIDGDHGFGRSFWVPGLWADLTASTVSARVESLLPAHVTLRRGGAIVAVAPMTGTTDLGPTAWLVGSSGRPLEIEAGDSIALEFTQPPDDGTLTMTVPELTLDYDLEAQRIWGRAAPGGTMWFAQGRLYGLPRLDSREVAPGIRQPNQAAVVPGADDDYEVVYPFGADLRPGAVLTTFMRLPIGHVVSRSRIVPVMSVRLGTGEVCVVGEPGDRMDLGLGDDPGRMSSATGSVDWTRGLQAFFRTPSGTEAIVSGGLTVEGRIGDLNVATRLDDMVIESVGLEPSSPRLNLGVTALGPVGREGFGRLRLTDDCAADAFSGVLPAWDRVGEGTSRLGRAYGSFDVSSEGRLREADLWRNGIELAFETSDGHRQYIVAYPFAPLELHVDTDRLSGHATRGEGLAFRLLTAGGTVRATARAVAGASNRFEVRLRDEDGRAVTLRAGDVLESEVPADMWACADGSNAVNVERLSYGFGPADGLTVDGPPNRPIRIELTLADGRELRIVRHSDGHGHLAISQAPPRSDWSLGQVRAVRLVLDTPSGHRIVREGRLDLGPPPTPVPPEPVPGSTRAWLPAALARSP